MTSLFNLIDLFELDDFKKLLIILINFISSIELKN